MSPAIDAVEDVLKMDKAIFVKDIALYSAAGTSPLAVFAAVDTVITSAQENHMASPALPAELALLSRYQTLLAQSVLRLLKKHPVERIYLQAPQQVYALLLNLAPESEAQIIHADIHLAEVSLPCIVAAVDSVQKQPCNGEAAVALLLTAQPEGAMASLQRKLFSGELVSDGLIFADQPTDKKIRHWYNYSEAHQITTTQIQLYPALGALGHATQLMVVAYALGRFNFSLEPANQLHYLTQEQNDEQYFSLEISKI